MFGLDGGCPQMMMQQCQSGHNQGRPIWVNYIYHYWLIMIMISMRIMIQRRPLSVHRACTGVGIHATALTFVGRIQMMLTNCISNSMEVISTWYHQCLIKLSWIRYMFVVLFNLKLSFILNYRRILGSKSMLHTLQSWVSQSLLKS